jgi:DNA repair protein RadC
MTHGNPPPRPRTERNDEPDRAGRREWLKERFLTDGMDGFSEYEVLELLLLFAIPGRDVRSTAQELLKEFGGLRKVLAASTVELSNVDGVDLHSAALVSLVRELTAYFSEKQSPASDLVNSPRDLEAYLVLHLKDVNDEQILVVFLDAGGEVLGDEHVGAGTIDRVVVFPRQIMEGALRHRASELIIAHNHPHGPPMPSVADREEAERLRAILLSFDLVLRDSIIVGHKRCFSIFRNCMLQDCPTEESSQRSR